jgi:alpha-tubulin suppressor-like RCC1 family protein
MKIKCGYSSTFVITSKVIFKHFKGEGKVYGFGENSSYELGLNDNKNKSSPTQIIFPNDEKIINIKCGRYHNFAISENGKIFSFGRNLSQELGLIERVIKVPTENKNIMNLGINKICCGDSVTFCLSV